MAPTLSVLLCLGECFENQNAECFENSAEDKGPLMLLGSSVTLSCWGKQGAEVYRLQKEQGSGRIKIQDVKPSVGEAQFSIPSMTGKDAGIYSCLYGHSSYWSEHSAPLHLVVTALPRSQVIPGQQVILQCLSQERFNWFALYKDGEKINSHKIHPHGKGAQVNFSIPTVMLAQGGTYTFYSNYPYKWSAPSDLLVLRVTGMLGPQTDNVSPRSQERGLWWRSPEDPSRAEVQPGSNTVAGQSQDTTKDPHLTQSPGDHQALTSPPPSE
ncbi:leukocyte immunoglobulin-like receptor subfamily A member 2 [Macrotis lagotis]|uniref:leukocyte immunoglobulin-like receptor subfamily A member 2 n=1 Tax=Macrotis lagotis TaxID=92651 RepID=UPI003D685918